MVVELINLNCYKFSISDKLRSTYILDCDAHSPVLLDLFLLNLVFVAFPLLGNSDNVSAFIDFLSNL